MGRFDMKDIRIRNKLENGYLCAATLIERKPEDKTCSYGPAGAVQSFPCVSPTSPFIVFLTLYVISYSEGVQFCGQYS